MYKTISTKISEARTNKEIVTDLVARRSLFLCLRFQVSKNTVRVFIEIKADSHVILCHVQAYRFRLLLVLRQLYDLRIK